jgi:Zn finger protein HypA/HybF involved in hydrogenase expression
VPSNLRCTDCEFVVYGIEEPEPRPVDRDDCPQCGGTEFEVL